ncbi:alpha-ketoglutarate-dependent sulfonate dioxygenase [Hypoxylon sp. FL1284]|nr:alpha-ketoglutarate-dependent sulfonate dioxygenase [Hypoxylon sp. FL1284]
MSAGLELLKHISPDTGLPITIHPHLSPKIKDHNPQDPIWGDISRQGQGCVRRSRRKFADPEREFADPEKKALFTAAKPVDLAESIGTVIENVQRSQLNPQQLDELALLVNKRGVVLFRNQRLTSEQQPSEKWHADTSFEINPPSYSLLRIKEHPAAGGDTAMVSGYGLYNPLRGAVHHRPVVWTRPVTGLKALDVNTGIVELKRSESDKLARLLPAPPSGGWRRRRLL